jgi:hypothetical protein
MAAPPPISITANQALAALDSTAGSKPAEAEVEVFLRDVLDRGPVDVSEVETMTRSAGLKSTAGSEQSLSASP